MLKNALAGLALLTLTLLGGCTLSPQPDPTPPASGTPTTLALAPTSTTASGVESTATLVAPAPVATGTPTSASVAVVATSTPPAPSCPAPAPVFASLWDVSMGCPLPATEMPGAYEYFERGQMLWRGDQAQIYVLNSAGSWAAYPDRWQEGAQEIACDVAQPLRLPKRGFGTLWCENLPVQEALGNAITGEEPSTFTVQSTESGTVLLYDAQDDARYVLFPDGTYRAEGTVPAPPTITPIP